jgi:hypothetical protein
MFSREQSAKQTPKHAGSAPQPDPSAAKFLLVDNKTHKSRSSDRIISAMAMAKPVSCVQDRVFKVWHTSSMHKEMSY